VIGADFLEILRCPESGARLKRGHVDLVARANQMIAMGRLRNRAGNALTKPIDGLLVRDDDRIGYPIIDDIPILLVDEALELDAPWAADART
jgi:uncharacterized protein YbaR (Trm112 family)